jgi:integrase/recombinase XerD
MCYLFMITSKSRKTQPSQSDLDWRKSLIRLEGAYAEGTLRAYRSDIETFVAWCEFNNETPFPARPSALSEFISHEAQRCATSTLKRRLAAIGKIHKLMKFENVVADEEVKLALRRALRSKFNRPNQALALTSKLRDQLLHACDNSLSGKRDRALITVGYDTLSRRSELIAICLEDLSFSEKGVRVLIKRSKNDPFGKGRISHLRYTTMELLQDWIEAADIKEGPLFRSIKHGKIHSTNLHPYSVNRIIKRAAHKAGLNEQEIQKLSGHSMRVGAAQDMMVAGLDILPIMAAGGWKTANVVARYVENADLSPLVDNIFRSNSLIHFG